MQDFLLEINNLFRSGNPSFDFEYTRDGVTLNMYEVFSEAQTATLCLMYDDHLTLLGGYNITHGKPFSVKTNDQKEIMQAIQIMLDAASHAEADKYTNWLISKGKR